MHLFALLVLVFVPCCISRAVNEYETNLQDEGNSMVNGRTFKPGQEYQDPPVNGFGDEGNGNENKKQAKDDDSILEDEGNTVVNGKNADSPEQEKRSMEIRTPKGEDNVEMDYNGWEKYSPNTSWCTVSGRELLSYYVLSAAECHALCDNKKGCRAVEYWEKYNDACFQCTDTSLVTPYTNEKDLAYPVYVWIRAHRPVWAKYSLDTSWCTVSGRELLSYDVLSAAECHALCDNKEGCHAVEYWEEYNDACFQCTDTSLVTAYTNTDDLAYPVYVWVRE